MDGEMSYFRPVDPTNGRMSTWQQHRNRRPPSSEPGTDYYCPRGTGVRAPARFIVRETYDGIGPAHGRFVAGDILDGSGRSFRDMHLWARFVSVGDVVEAGAVYASSGATGYGLENWENDPDTGGAHVHRSLFARPWWQASQTIGNTLDPELYSSASGSGAGAGSDPFEEDDMFSDSDRALLQDVQNKLSISGAGYGRPEVIQQRTDAIFDRILPPGAPYDQLQLIVSQQQQLLTAIAAENGADFPALFAKMQAELKADQAIQIERVLTEVRTALAGVDGVTEADLDAALATLTISRSS